jgi:ribose 5-phosphate isomerase B
MKIALACDHGGFDFKNALREKLKKEGHLVHDFGCLTKDSCDYPDFAISACLSVTRGGNDRAILICTNGIGMAIAANKISKIRAALVYSEKTARVTREHHDSNVLCLGAGEFNFEELFSVVKIWLETNFSNEERHLRRINKLKRLEEFAPTPVIKI